MTTIAVNLKNSAGSQFTNYNYTDFVKVGDVVYGFNSDGIHSLDTADKDNATDIDAYFTLVNSDFGIANNKRIRKGFVGYEGGEIEVTIRYDDKSEYTVPVTPVTTGQHVGVFKGRHDYLGSHIQIKVGNVDGDDFSVDSISIIPFILRLKPGGSKL